MNLVKKICTTLKLSLATIRTEEDLRVNRVKIRDLAQGVLAVDRKYGRGADLRFARDSHILVPFQLELKSELHQLMGRSSRTGARNFGTFIYQDEQLSADTVIEMLTVNDNTVLNENARVINIMRGRRFLNVKDDSELLKLFKLGWNFDHNRIVKIVGKNNAFTFEGCGSEQKIIGELAGIKKRDHI